jgi:hypothetical protein
MILTDPQILEIMQKPRNGEAITAGVKLQNEHKLHVTGEGYPSQVRKIEGWESSSDFSVKSQIAKPATIQITAIALDNLNRWASAQGTIKRVDFKDTEKNKRFEEVLDQVWHGHSYEDFTKEFVKEAIYTEFNGFALVTKPKVLEGGFIEKEGIISKFEGASYNPYIIFIAAGDVYDFHLTGTKVEYLIIKLGTEVFRLIDDEKDRIFTRNSQSITVTSELVNETGYVPAIKISNINHKLLNDQVKTSPIDHVIPALDRYFSSDSDLRMQFIKHNYPKLAIVTKECSICHGNGKTAKYNENTETYDINTLVQCSLCGGTGKIIPISCDGVIGLPQYLEQGHTAYPGSPASYITPDTASLQLGIQDLKQQREDIIYSATGDKNLITESLNTATENTINNRSLEDRIAEISSMVEQFEIFLKKCIKDLHNEFKGIKDYSITVKYGRRITTKGEGDLMKEILDAKNASLPLSYIQGLHKDLIYTKYKNNKDELDRYLILSDIEPLSAFSMDEISKMKSSINPDDVELKMNFDSLIDLFEEDNLQVQYYAPEQPYKKRVSLIKSKLYEILSKQEWRSGRDRGQDVGLDPETGALDQGNLPDKGGLPSNEFPGKEKGTRKNANFQPAGTAD